MRKLVNLLATCIVSVLATLGVVYALTPFMPSIPFTFSQGTTINPSQMNANFTAVQNSMNAIQTGGSWIPADASGAALVFSNVSASYTQLGNMVFAYATLTYPVTVDATNSLISGLPVSFPTSPYGTQCTITHSTDTTSFIAFALPIVSTTTLGFWNSVNNRLTNAALSNSRVIFECIYPAS
jgi:hypothetical protein